MSKYFGTNGVRGKFEELNPLLAMKLAQAIGIYLKHGKILLTGLKMKLPARMMWMTLPRFQ